MPKGHILIGVEVGNHSMTVDQDDYVLTADSGQATGVKRAPASSNRCSQWFNWCYLFGGSVNQEI